MLGNGDRSRAPEVVVITGASAGVGRAAVRRFAKEKAKIGLLARGVDGLEGARAEVEECGGRALAIPTDVADPEQVEAAADRVERELGPIDIWVNDAMVTVFSPFLEITPEDYRRATDVTYLGFVNGTRSALKRMVPRNRGTIVQVGSALAYRSIPLQSPYCGAKAAIRGFTDSVRTELLHSKSGVHITMVQMPGLNTPQFEWCATTLPKHPKPIPPIYQPEVAAEAIYFAAHHRRREVYVGRATVATILGERVAPGLLDRYLAKTGFDSQQTQEPIPKNRPNNLFRPLPGDHGAHGEFDAQSERHSPQFWADTHRGLLALIGIGMGALVSAAVYKARA
jgi:NAD(P)-dependent dehydrogenase (short-subunit alcohol dehydrogenase family)